MPSISTAPPAVPLPSSLLGTIRSSSQAVAVASGIQLAAADKLEEVLSTLTSPASARDYSILLPLRWDSTAQEVNFISLLSLLSILSPSQTLLQQLPSRPTASSIPRHLLLGLYLSAPPSNHQSAPSPLSSGHIAELKDGEIADVLGLKIHQEKAVAHIPVATLAERGGPGSEVTERLRRTLNRIGERLVQNRYVDLGAFVQETLTQCKTIASSRGEEEAVGHFVNRLVSFLPDDFADAHNVTQSSTQSLHLYKNALLLLLSITLRFSSTSGASHLLWLPSLDVFPLLADSVLPGLLVSRSLLDFSSAKDAKLRAWSEAVLSGTADKVELEADQASVLRAAAVWVGEELRSELKEKGRTVIDLDAQLRRVLQEERSKEAGISLVIKEREIEEAGRW